MKLNSDCSLFGEGISSPAASLTPNVPDLISLTHATRFGIVSSNLSNFPAVSLSFFRCFDAAAGVSASHTFHWATSLRDISIEPRTNSRTSFLDRWYGANSLTIASTISLNRASSTAALAVKALAFDGGFLFARLVECGGWVRSVFDRTSSLCRFSKSDHLRVKDAACRQLETASREGGQELVAMAQQLRGNPPLRVGLPAFTLALGPPHPVTGTRHGAKYLPDQL
jgi:hypothetical protein